MKNSSLNSFNTDTDFKNFIDSRFKYPVDKNFNFPAKYDEKRAPKSFLDNMETSEKKRIIERELIRDNIYLKYRFDIFEYPFVVYFEDRINGENLKPFKLAGEAKRFCKDLLDKEVTSLFIEIMNHDMECSLYKK